MPYRTLARNEHAEQDNAEIASIARQSRVRVMRVGLVLVAMFAMVFATAVAAVAAAASNRDHEKLHCHKVSIVYEDSIHYGTAPPPPATHTVCEWR